MVQVLLMCMKIGVISDVHSNKVALEAVLSDMPSVDSLVCLGDVVGYNPWPVKSVETVKDQCDYVIQGNHDREVVNAESYRSNEMAYEGLKLSNNKLSDSDINWLQGLPESDTWFDGEVLAAHSHPEVTDEYVPPRFFTKLGANYLEEPPYVVLLGHTHVQHKVDMSKFDGVSGLVVNPGSVGQPRDGDPRAAYAVLKTEGNNYSKSFSVDLHRVSYDVEKVNRKISELGLPEKTGLRLLDGR